MRRVRVRGKGYGAQSGDGDVAWSDDLLGQVWGERDGEGEDAGAGGGEIIVFRRAPDYFCNYVCHDIL